MAVPRPTAQGGPSPVCPGGSPRSERASALFLRHLPTAPPTPGWAAALPALLPQPTDTCTQVWLVVPETSRLGPEEPCLTQAGLRVGVGLQGLRVRSPAVSTRWDQGACVTSIRVMAGGADSGHLALGSMLLSLRPCPPPPLQAPPPAPDKETSGEAEAPRDPPSRSLEHEDFELGKSCLSPPLPARPPGHQWDHRLPPARPRGARMCDLTAGAPACAWGAGPPHDP